MTFPAGYSPLGSGYFVKATDNSGPYVFDGVTMALLGTAVGGLSQFNRMAGGNLAQNYTIHAASGLALLGPGYYCGLHVTIALSATQVITLRDGVSAGVGNIVDVISALTPIGPRMIGDSLPLGAGLYANYFDASAGTIVVKNISGSF